MSPQEHALFMPFLQCWIESASDWSDGELALYFAKEAKDALIY